MLPKDLPKQERMFGMPIKNDVLISAASYKKDINIGGHPKQIFGPSYFLRALDK